MQESFSLHEKSNRKTRSKVNIPGRQSHSQISNFNVLLVGAWLVRDMKTAGGAIGVAISEAGKRLNQRRMDFVEVDD